MQREKQTELNYMSQIKGLIFEKLLLKVSLYSSVFFDEVTSVFFDEVNEQSKYAHKYYFFQYFTNILWITPGYLYLIQFLSETFLMLPYDLNVNLQPLMLICIFT